MQPNWRTFIIASGVTRVLITLDVSSASATRCLSGEKFAEKSVNIIRISAISLNLTTIFVKIVYTQKPRERARARVPVLVATLIYALFRSQ